MTTKRIMTMVAMIVSLVAVAANAGLITIANHSFELDDIDAGQLQGGAPTNWVTAGGAHGMYDRTAGLRATWIDPTPDGTDQLFYSNGQPVSQVLETKIAVNTKYTLTVDIGDRTNEGFSGAELRLGTGSTVGASLLTATVVANTIPVNGAGAADGWETWVYTFTTGESVVDDYLRVEIDSGGAQMLADNVRLEATAIPEPATLGLLGFAGVCSLLIRRIVTC